LIPYILELSKNLRIRPVIYAFEIEPSFEVHFEKKKKKKKKKKEPPPLIIINEEEEY